MYSQKTDVTIIRSNRKTVSIEVKPDLTVTLRVPRRITENEIDQILNEKQSWINKHLEQMQARNSELERVNSQCFLWMILRSWLMRHWHISLIG